MLPAYKVRKYVSKGGIIAYGYSVVLGILGLLYDMGFIQNIKIQNEYKDVCEEVDHICDGRN